MERKIEFSVGEFYHLYNRGVEKRNIFLDSQDRERFLRLLYVASGKTPIVYRDIRHKPLAEIGVGRKIVAIGAYALMSNHIHILVKEIVAGGLSMYMEKLMTAYVKYFNKKHDRVGSLFQGRFKAEHVDKDEYLKYLYAYIHLNPIKIIEPTWKESGIRNTQRAEKFLANYRYSSYWDYIGINRQEQIILTPGEFPEYFENKRTFIDLHARWLQYKNT